MKKEKARKTKFKNLCKWEGENTGKVVHMFQDAKKAPSPKGL